MPLLWCPANYVGDIPEGKTEITMIFPGTKSPAAFRTAQAALHCTIQTAARAAQAQAAQVATQAAPA